MQKKQNGRSLDHRLREGVVLILLLALTAGGILTLAGCSQKELIGDPVEAYLTVIQALEEPEAFKSEEEMKYIVVDTRGMTGLKGKEDKKRLFGAIQELYSVETLDKNQVQLAREGYLEDNNFNDGVLFRILEADYGTYDKSPVSIEVQEWGRGSKTLIQRCYTLEMKNGIWEIIDTEEITEKKLS